MRLPGGEGGGGTRGRWAGWGCLRSLVPAEQRGPQLTITWAGERVALELIWVCVVFLADSELPWRGCLPGWSSVSAPQGCGLGWGYLQAINEAESNSLCVPPTLQFG